MNSFQLRARRVVSMGVSLVVALLFVLFFVLFFAKPLVAAPIQYVEEALRQPAPGTPVRFEGRFVKQINYETYLFDDETGRIEVIVEEDDPLPSRAVKPGARVLLIGEIGSGYQEAPVVHFDSCRVLAMDQVPESAVVEKKESVAVAEPVVPAPPGSVAAAQARRDYGGEITLKGVFVRKVNYETLLFADDTGEIEVVFAEDDFMPTDWSQRVELQGTLIEGYRGESVVGFESLRVLPGAANRIVPTAETVSEEEPKSLLEVLGVPVSGKNMLLEGRVLLFVQPGVFVLQDETAAVVVDGQNLRGDLAQVHEGDLVVIKGWTRRDNFSGHHAARTAVEANRIQVKSH